MNRSWALVIKAVPLLIILSVSILTNACGKDAGENLMDVNAASLVATVKFLTTLQPPRSYESTGSLNAAATYIHDRFTTFGLKTTRQAFTISNREYANIIGVLNEEKVQRIVIGAHYDVFGNLPGADDNASGIAVLIEVARLVKHHLAKSNYRFEFVAFALEEPPFFASEHMGSYIHAKSLFDQQADVRAMICLEMVGYFTGGKKSQKYPLGVMKLFYPDQGNFIAVVGNLGSGSLVRHVKKGMEQASIPVSTLKAPAWFAGVDLSDHRNYWQFGYKAVMVTDTSFYRNPHYHQPTDTIETLDFDKMKEVAKGLLQALVLFN
jgi:Peptidase family M28